MTKLLFSNLLFLGLLAGCRDSNDVPEKNMAPFLGTWRLQSLTEISSDTTGQVQDTVFYPEGEITFLPPDEGWTAVVVTETVANRLWAWVGLSQFNALDCGGGKCVCFAHTEDRQTRMFLWGISPVRTVVKILTIEDLSRTRMVLHQVTSGPDGNGNLRILEQVSEWEKAS